MYSIVLWKMLTLCFSSWIIIVNFNIFLFDGFDSIPVKYNNRLFLLPKRCVIKSSQVFKENWIRNV